MSRISLPVVSTNGFVFYDGPSLLDGTPVLGVAVGLSNPSENVKTGALVQTYVLVKGEKPTEAIKSGADVSICGDCLHREAGSCYVNAARAVDQTWKKVMDGTYRPAAPSLVAGLAPGRKWRLGSYGDPAALPLEVWDELLSECADRIGYTHQWQDPRFAGFSRLVMASAEREAQARLAWSMNWRTYRTKLKGERRLPGEIVCPASKEKGYARTCETCMACDGSKGMGDRRRSVVINAHGLSWKVDRFAQAVGRKQRHKRRKEGNDR